MAFYSLVLAVNLGRKFAILPRNIANLIPYDRLKTERDFREDFALKSTDIRYAKIGVFNKLKQLALYVDHDSIDIDFNDADLNILSLDRMLSNLNLSKIYVEHEDYLTFARIIFSVTATGLTPDAPSPRA